MGASFDALSLSAVRAEIEPRLVGGRVQKIVFPDQHSLALEVFAPATGRVTLLLSAHPEGMNAGEIQGELGIPHSTLSHHLEKLKNEELVTMQRSSMDATANAIDDNATGSTTLIVTLAACAVLLGAAISWLLTHGIVRPIREAVSVAETVAGGDLTRSIVASTNDETGAGICRLRVGSQWLSRKRRISRAATIPMLR